MAKSKFWTSDRIVSFSAMFISLITLFIFIKQTNIIERQSKLSAMPYLMMDTSNSSVHQTYAIDLVNYGIGPAFIESTSFIYKGQTYQMQFVDFLREIIPEMEKVNVTNFSTIYVGQSIPAEDKVNILTAGRDSTSYTTFIKIMEQLRSEKFDYKVRYKSIYNEYWEIDGTTEIPKKIR